MQIEWKISAKDIKKIKNFVDSYKDNLFVRDRIERNCNGSGFKLTKDTIWKVMVGCLLTTQQRSGPESNIARFLRFRPFQLSYNICMKQRNVEIYAYNSLTSFGGIRRTNRIANDISVNLSRLENGLWPELISKLRQLKTESSSKLERNIANYIDDNFQGFGPKQSRNLLQWMGLTLYEIPIDSRITKWLNDFGFPVKLNAAGLGDRYYYQFVSDGIQQLCKSSDIYPCIFDAAIFASFDGDKWTKDNVGY